MQFKNVHIENVSSDEVDTSNSIVINSDQEYYELLKQLNEDNNDIVEMDIDSTRTKVKFTLKGVAGTTVIYKGLPTLLRTNLTYKFSYNITNARE